MSNRSIALHLALLILALAAAWITFRQQLTADTPGDEAAIVLLQAAEGDLERVVYEARGRSLHLESHFDDGGRWFEGWEVVAAEEAEEGTETEPKVEEATEVFRGGAAVGALWHRLEPLRVSRILGHLDPEKLAELELAENAISLTLTLRGRDHRFSLGGETYGTFDRYAQEDGGRVLVFPAELTRDLEAGRSRLMERRVIRATRPEVESLALSRRGRTASIVQRRGAEPAESFWSLAGQESASGEFLSWVDKFFRLQVRRYRPRESGPDWRTEATITVHSREHGPDTLEIWSVDEGGEKVWLGRSGDSRLVAELALPLAEEVCQDLDSLLP